MAKDELYRDPDMKGGFKFDSKVADVFDDMLNRSVPCYRMVIEMVATILGKFLQPGDQVFDLGCSTGETMVELARKLNHQKLEFTGVDNSPAMLEKANHKAEMFSLGGNLKFIEADITDLDLPPKTGAVIMNYTLQFLEPAKRPEFLSSIYNAMRPGGLLIISEKTISPRQETNRTYIDFYQEFKRTNGYSETEISRKRQALENILIPFSIKDNLNLLTEAGFRFPETFFQWFNFTSFLAFKE